jgi:hypothetical protein
VEIVGALQLVADLDDQCFDGRSDGETIECPIAVVLVDGEEGDAITQFSKVVVVVI